MARSTSWAGSSMSVPSTFSKRPSTSSTSCRRSAATRPAPSSRKHSVLTLKSRSPPSSWADDVR